jgi:hypothetical protein
VLQVVTPLKPVQSATPASQSASLSAQSAAETLQPVPPGIVVNAVSAASSGLVTATPAPVVATATTGTTAPPTLEIFTPPSVRLGRAAAVRAVLLPRSGQ